MQQPIRFVEKETGAEVLVTTTFVWGDEAERASFVTYPSGKTFALSDAQLALHFEIVRPQEVFLTAFGGTDERPTAAQRLLEQ